jgi:hypothetical protein
MNNLRKQDNVMRNICEERAKKEHSGVRDFLKETEIKLLRSL